MGCKFSSNVKSRIITSLTTRARRNAGSFTSGNHSTQLALLSMSGYFLLIGFGPGKRHNRNYSVKVHKPKKNFQCIQLQAAVRNQFFVCKLFSKSGLVPLRQVGRRVTVNLMAPGLSIIMQFTSVLAQIFTSNKSKNIQKSRDKSSLSRVVCRKSFVSPKLMGEKVNICIQTSIYTMEIFVTVFVFCLFFCHGFFLCLYSFRSASQVKVNKTYEADKRWVSFRKSRIVEMLQLASHPVRVIRSVAFIFQSKGSQSRQSRQSQSRLGKSVKGLLVQVKDRLKIIGTCHPVSFRVCPVKIISQSVSQSRYQSGMFGWVSVSSKSVFFFFFEQSRIFVCVVVLNEEKRPAQSIPSGTSERSETSRRASSQLSDSQTSP